MAWGGENARASVKILFTGASSFTGYWFVKELAAAGHEVAATFTGQLDAYLELRKRRVDALLEICEPLWSAPFGGKAFMDAIRRTRYDVLCHHGAFVTDYKSPDFDFVRALTHNTCKLKHVLRRLADNGLRRVVLTGSVFEPGEGAGELPLRAFSPYGLSKAMTAQAFEYECGRHGLSFGKFVIPNPFGPFEEPKFTHYLIKSWFNDQAASVKTPRYVRDNIHVSLLAKAYAEFATGTKKKLNPSGYVESQGAFARRVAQEIGSRLNLKCPLILEDQTDFPEPVVRINTERLDTVAMEWSEKRAWNELAEYYAALRSEIT